ncbi:MAG TPA: GxxExxY protein [Bacteroidales bacterium]|jgi:GxxExxY protein|nr:GxxExxY protein [Bacteroidales bacterium]HPE40204.1 GxxExxY protein [Bacteroidales bacterium]
MNDLNQLNKLTDKVINCFFKVYNTLGYGFLEKVYERALLIELSKIGLKVESQKPIKVHYDKQVIGDYYADIMVNDIVILELKAVEVLCEQHELQLINYLKATDIEYGLLLNFGKRPEVRRKIFTNNLKK